MTNYRSLLCIFIAILILQSTACQATPVQTPHATSSTVDTTLSRTDTPVPTATPPTPRATASPFIPTATPTPTSADTGREPQRITFDPGTISAEVVGHLEIHETDTYVLRAVRGQTIVLDIESENEGLTVTVRGPSAEATIQTFAVAPLRDGWCGLLTASQDTTIEISANTAATDYRLTATIPAKVLDLPAMILAKPEASDTVFHVLDAEGNETIVHTSHNSGCTGEAVTIGDALFCNDQIVSAAGSTPLTRPDRPDECRGPLPAPDGQHLAWICDDVDPHVIMQGSTPDAHVELVLTDRNGEAARVIWQQTQTAPNYRRLQLVSWRQDGEKLYVSRPELQASWCCFNYAPALLAIDIDSGEATQIGEESAFDAAVSSDGAWLAQSYDAATQQVGAITLSALENGANFTIPYSPGADAAGAFTFSPDGNWLVWQEHVRSPDSVFTRVRAVPVPVDREPISLYEAPESETLTVGGWLTPDTVVLNSLWGTERGSRVFTLPVDTRGCWISHRNTLVGP